MNEFTAGQVPEQIQQATDHFNDQLDEAAKQIHALADHIVRIRGDQHHNSTQAARSVVNAVIDNLTELRLTNLLALGARVDELRTQNTL